MDEIIVENFEYSVSDCGGDYFQGRDIHGHRIVGYRKNDEKEIVWELEKGRWWK